MAKKKYTPKGKLSEKTRLKLSNLAHERLGKKYSLMYSKTWEEEKKSDVVSYIKHGYHYSVQARQEKLNRFLTEKEKKDLYRASVYFTFN